MECCKNSNTVTHFYEFIFTHPASQPGLQAYYTFDNLINKQGNTAWDGFLSGAGIIPMPEPRL